MRKLIDGSIGQALDATLVQAKAVQSFAMTASYRLQHHSPALIAGDAVLVYPGELLTIVALPGTGKTQICEAIAGAYIADYHTLEDKDTLQLQAKSTPAKRCLYVDTERPHDDNYKSFERIMRRVGADADASLLSADGELTAMDYRCFVALADTKQLKEELERLTTESQYGLIIIDGVLDFVDSMNNEEECSAIVKWLRAMAQNQGAAIAVTLHPNKGSDTMAGHLGAMLYRYSRACLAAKPYEQNSDVKLLTNQFSQGKLSHGNAEVCISFMWDKTARMMRSLPDDASPLSAGLKVNRLHIQQVFNSFAIAGRFWVPSNEIKADYVARFGKSMRTAKDHFSFASQQGWIERRGEARKPNINIKRMTTIDTIANRTWTGQKPDRNQTSTQGNHRGYIPPYKGGYNTPDGTEACTVSGEDGLELKNKSGWWSVRTPTTESKSDIKMQNEIIIKITKSCNCTGISPFNGQGGFGAKRALRYKASKSPKGDFIPVQ